jgi:hypothetical protein
MTHTTVNQCFMADTQQQTQQQSGLTPSSIC